MEASPPKRWKLTCQLAPMLERYLTMSPPALVHTYLHPIEDPEVAAQSNPPEDQNYPAKEHQKKKKFKPNR